MRTALFSLLLLTACEPALPEPGPLPVIPDGGALDGGVPHIVTTADGDVLARRALRESDASVAEIARSVGYTSESAFSQAFKRETGLAPRHYRDAPPDEHARLRDAHAFS